MKRSFAAARADVKLLFRSLPSAVTALFVVSVVIMNLLANKTIYQSEFLALDGGILISWLTFLCMDIVTKAFGPRAATELSVFAIAVNLGVCLLFALAAAIPTEEDFSAFDSVLGGTWFILVGSTAAFLVSAVVNNFLNRAVGRLFHKNPDGWLAFVTRSYVSTFVGQFVDNFVFASLTFMVLAPIFWDGFSWTPTQCFTCSLIGAAAELVTEAVFSPIGYRVLRQWEKDGVGEEYRRRNGI